MDDDASYAAVTMIQTNVRAHQIRKRKQKDRGSNGAPSAPDTPPTPFAPPTRQPLCEPRNSTAGSSAVR